MYVDSEPAAGGWQVEPSEVREFADAVEQVRADLDKVVREVEDMSTPEYAPLLGTSPVGQELAQKFVDRMGSEHGLRGQLDVAVRRMEEFVLSAEKSAATYLQVDSDHATNLTMHE